MSDAKETFTSTDELFAMSLDDLADLPSFETPPAGAYILDVSCDVKTINDKPAVEASFIVVETVELKDQNATPVADGTKFSTAFLLGNKYGVGNMKKFLKPFGAHFEENSIEKLVRDVVKDVRIAATVTNRVDKEDPDKIYGGVKDITVM